MRDIHLIPPEIGQRVSRGYLTGLQELASHDHDPGLGIVTRNGVVVAPDETSAAFRIYTCQLTADLLPGSTATAILLVGPTKSATGDTITVYDTPTSITTAKKIANGTKCRVFKDHDMDLSADEYVLLIPFTCEADQ